MSNLPELADQIDRLSTLARVQELGVFLQEGEKARRQKLEIALSQLSPGAYLLGAGIYTQGIYSVMCDEVVLGRMATPVEEPLDRAVDILIRDAASYTPREVSRYHAVIQRFQAGLQDYFISDCGSSCGTYVNGHRISDGDPKTKTPGQPNSIKTGDIISLGSSGVNTFVFAILAKR